MVFELIVFILLIIYIKYLYLATCSYKESIYGNKTSRGFFLDNEGLSKMNEREFKIKTKPISFKDSFSLIRKGYIFEKQNELTNQNNNNIEYTFILFHDSIFNYFNLMEYVSLILDNFKCKIIFFPFSGYAGNPSFSISNSTLVNDSKQILNYLLIENNENYEMNNIFLIGKGLGAGIILNIVNNYESSIQGIILENPFSSLIDWIKYTFSYGSCFISFILKDEINNKLSIKILECPILFLASKDDSVIPCSQSENLFNLAINTRYKDIKIINFADHHDIYKIGMKSYLKKIKEFLTNSKDFSETKLVDSEIIINGRSENSILELEENMNLDLK